MPLIPSRRSRPEDASRVIRVELPEDQRPEFAGPGRQVNYRALIILGVSATLLVAGFFPLLWYQEGRVRVSALAEAQALSDRGEIDQALIRLSHYLENWPDDIPALELAARLFTDSARSLDEILYAASLQDRLIRLDPSGPERQENRRRLTLLYIRYGEGLRYASTRQELTTDKFGSRFRAAVKIAGQRIAFGADDADAHRLLAQALEGLSTTGDARALSDATIEYEKALRLDAGDLISAERLSTILLDKRKDRGGAEEILEELIRAKPDSVQARLVRFRFFAKTLQPARATSELQEAASLAPTDPLVRMSIAGDALRRGDPAEARRNLDAIPGDGQASRQATILRGQIDLSEQHPDEAIDLWRRQLVDSGGGDRELTWQLAQTLIRLGRLAEAKPLVARFQQLSGSPGDPMSRMLAGMLKERTGHPTAAIADLEQARENVGEIWRADLEMILGRCYESINDQTRAIGAYRKAIEAAPWSSAARLAIARIISKTAPEQAAQEVERSLAMNPEDPSSLAELASVRIRQQLALPEDRREWKPIEAILARGPADDPSLLKLRAQLLALSDRSSEAIALLEKATAGPARRREELWIARANLVAGQGRVDEAVQLLESAKVPEILGDHAGVRIALSGLLGRTGRARAAREQLTLGIGALSVDERAALARAQAELAQELGDPKASRESCLEWARLAPDDPQPGLFLLAQAQQGGGEESARQGLALLEAVGGQDEPYALAARALDLLGSTRVREETRSARIELAEQLIAHLQTVAPTLPVSYLLRGMVMERDHRIEEAINAYRIALQGATRPMALSRLVSLFVRQKRFGDLDRLREETDSAPEIDRYSAQLAYEMGDVERAESIVALMAQARPDSLEMRGLQARLLRDLGKPREAEDLLRGLVTRQPDQPGPWLALLALQVGQRDRDAAEATLVAAAEQYKGERPTLLQARGRWEMGDLARAAELTEQLLREGRDEQSTRFGVDFFDATGRLDRAEALLRQVLEADPMASWAAGRLALLLTSPGRRDGWAEAWTLVRPGAITAGESAEERLLRSTILSRSPDPARRAESAATLKALLDDVPATGPIGLEARARIAQAALDANRPGEAAEVLGPVIADPAVKDPAALAVLTEALARIGQVDEAARQLVRVKAADPRSIRALACQAWVFAAKGKGAEASAAVGDALEVEQKANRGASSAPYVELLTKIGQADAALSLARRVASKRPGEGWILAGQLADRGKFVEAMEASRLAVAAGTSVEPLRLAMLVAAAHRHDAQLVALAASVADAAMTHAVDDPVVMSLIAPIRHFQGHYDEEIDLLRRQTVRTPEDPVPLNNLAWALSECAGRADEAIGLVDRAYALGSPTTGIVDTRGVILARLGRFDDAIKDLQLAVRRQPSASYYYHLAWAAMKAGKPELHAHSRDMAKKLGFDPKSLEVAEQAEFAAVMAP